MANTLNGMTHDNIARLGLSALEDALVPMSGFTTDLSTDTIQGTTVSTRIVPAATASTDIEDAESGSYASVVDNQTTTPVQVTLDPHPATGFAFSDLEWQRLNQGVMEETVRRMIKTHVRGIAEDVLGTVFALITSGNYSTAAFTGAASLFDADDVVDIRTAAVNAGMRPEDMVLVLNPEYYGALLKDNAIQDFSSSQADALRTGTLPKLSGFTVIEAPTLPTNSQNLVGFAALPDAIAVAMRGVDSQDRSPFLHYEIMKGDAVGAVMTYSAVYMSQSTRKVDHIFEALYGASVANGSALMRIASA